LPETGHKKLSLALRPPEPTDNNEVFASVLHLQTYYMIFKIKMQAFLSGFLPFGLSENEHFYSLFNRLVT